MTTANTNTHCEACEGLGFIHLEDPEPFSRDCRDCDGVRTYAPDIKHEPLWDAACERCEGTGEIDIINPDWMGSMAGEIGHSECSCRTRRVIEYNALCEACHRGRLGGNGELCACATDVTVADLSRYGADQQIARLVALAQKLRDAGRVTAARAKLAVACEFLSDEMRTGEKYAAASERVAQAAKAVAA